MAIYTKSHVLRVNGYTRKQIWQVWSDINNWYTWDHDIKWAKIEAPFQNGSIFYLKPKSGPKVKITLIDVVRDQSFTDLAIFPGAKMYSIHNLTDIDSKVELTHTIRMEGLLSFVWWHIVGKNVAEAMEQQSQKLLERIQKVCDK